MPSHQVGLPVSATAITLKDNEGNAYPLVLGTDTFNRLGEDGNIPIIPICGGDEMIGTILEG